MSNDHSHKFDPANAARLDSPRRREFLPPMRLAEALPLRPGDRVLDIGCGTGYWLMALIESAPPGVAFTGVDTEPAMLELIADRLKNHPKGQTVVLKQSTEHELPLPDASVDAAVMGMVYHELSDRRRFLREIRRTLAPGGRLAIVDWDTLPPGVERTWGRQTRSVYPSPSHQPRCRMKDLKGRSE